MIYTNPVVGDLVVYNLCRDYYDYVSGTFKEISPRTILGLVVAVYDVPVNYDYRSGDKETYSLTYCDVYFSEMIKIGSKTDWKDVYLVKMMAPESLTKVSENLTSIA